MTDTDNPVAAHPQTPTLRRASLLTFLLCLATALGTSLAVAPGPDLWDALLTSAHPMQAGFAGSLLWKSAWALGELRAILGLRSLLVVGALLALWPRWKREGGTTALGWAGRMALVGAFGALLPSGPGALTPVLAVFGLGLVPSPAASGRAWRLGGCAALALVWPWLDAGFLPGVGVVALAGWSVVPSTRSPGGGTIPLQERLAPGLFLILSCLSPPGAQALLNGSGFLPLASAWVGVPPYAPPSLASPAFWLTLTTVVVLMYGAWHEGRRLTAATFGSACALGLGVYASLPAALLLSFSSPLFASRGEGYQEDACASGPGGPKGEVDSCGTASSPWLPLVLAPFLIWTVAVPPGHGVPRGALELLREIPAGGWRLRTEPSWRSRCGMELRPSSGRKTLPVDAPTLLPEPNCGGLLAFRRDYPEGLVPPFEHTVDPGTDLLLLAPEYSEVRFPRPLLPGWHLVSAGEDYALFGRDRGPVGAWVEKTKLRVYSPFEPLPEDAAWKETALEECLALARRSPRFFLALRDAGRLATDLGRFDLAEEKLREALTLRPSEAQTWNDLAVALQMSGELDGAREAYLKSIALRPAELLPRLNLAGLFMSQQKPSEAEFILGDILKAHSGYLPARRLLVQVLLAQGKVEEARKTVAEIPPDSRLPAEEALLRGEAVLLNPQPGEGQGPPGGSP